MTPMAHYPEPQRELTWTLAFAFALLALIAIGCLVGVLAIGGAA